MQKPVLTVEDQQEGRIPVLAVVLIVLGIALVACSGCANMRPVINENGGGGIAVTSEQGSWFAPVLYTAGGVYALSEIIKAMESDDSHIENYGTLNQYTAGNDNLTNSQNRENPKRVKVEARRAIRR